MPHYRAYLLNPAGGIMRAEDIEADAADVALHAASMLLHPHEVEVWKGAELVGRVTPNTSATGNAQVGGSTA
jgi:hypothetical protein